MTEKIEEEDGGSTASVPTNTASGGQIDGLDMGYPAKKSKKTDKIVSLIKKKMVRRKPV